MDDDLLAELRLARQRWEASSDQPVTVQNRLMGAVSKACQRLAGTAEGRMALEHAAVSDLDPSIRLVAAKSVQEWDVERAATALETLIRDLGGTVQRPMTMHAAVNQPSGHLLSSAAICLYDLDRRAGSARAGVGRTVSATIAPSVPMSSDLLRSAESVYNLAMSGGLAHAFEVAGDSMPDAIRALRLVGVARAADILQAALDVLCDGLPIPFEMDNRGATVERLSPESDATLAGLNEEFTDIDVMAQLQPAIAD